LSFVRLASVLVGVGVLVLPAACGGGGPGAPAAGLVDPGATPPPNPGPDVALVLVSGHAFVSAPSYLEDTAGAFLGAALVDAGYTVETFAYVDDGDGGAFPGYTALLDDLQAIHDDWIDGRPDPTRILLVPHSHGGVWAHGAARALPDVPIHLLVDLDVSSNAWSLLHASETALLGGDPEGAHTLPVEITCPQFPDLASEAGTQHDLEDVVFPNVHFALEVRSGDVVPNPLQFEMYDERWNGRLDGSVVGLDCYASDTDHLEVQSASGATLAFVRDWILSRLEAE
jgi:hypothetical protein